MFIVSGSKIIKDSVLSSVAGSFAKLDSALAASLPAILKVEYVKNGVTHPHFIVATNKLQGTYEINDPSYFNTHYLDESQPDFPNRINDYDNTFLGNRVLRRTTTISSNFPISSLRVTGGKNVYIQDLDGHISGIRDGEILNEIKEIEFIQYNNPPDSGEEDSVPGAYINEYGFEFDSFMKGLVLYADSDKENKRPIMVDEFAVREGKVLANNHMTLNEDIESIKKELIIDESPHLIHTENIEVADTVFYKGDPMYKDNEIK